MKKNPENSKKNGTISNPNFRKTKVQPNIKERKHNEKLFHTLDLPALLNAKTYKSTIKFTYLSGNSCALTRQKS